MKDALGQSQSNWLRTALAVGIGLLGAVTIWIVGPYNNYLFSNTNITDGFLPVAVICLTLILALAVNPLLRRINPSLSLNRRQMAMIVGIMLVAMVVPGQGLMRMLPSSLVRIPVAASSDGALAEEFQKMDLPAGTFPDEIEYGAAVEASERFVGELDALGGETVPWSAWVGWRSPLMIWGSLVLFGWLLMLGMAMIVLPQWRDNERLAFPLLRVQEALIADPDKGRFFAPMFRKRGFWIAVIVVVVLRLMNGFSSYYPESVPSIPLAWNLSSLFTEEPWVYLSKPFYSGKLFFLLIGITYFMPNRTSFSLWFLIVVYFVYEMVGKAYFPPYHPGTFRDHRLGAIFAIALGVLWLGRKRWAHVFKTMFVRARGASDRQDRLGGYMFVLGVLGVFAWLLYMKVQPGFAVLFTVFIFMTSLVMSRAIAEAGLPFFRIRSELMRVVRLFPAKLISATSIYISVMIGILFTVTTRSSAAALSTHAFALNENAGRKNRGMMAVLFLAVLVIGALISGAVHLNMNYHNSSTLAGQSMISGGGYMWAGDATFGVKDLRSGSTQNPGYSREGHILGAFIAAAVLFVLCLAMPRWPLHPIGLLAVQSWVGKTMWPSILVGWLIKQVMVRYGGARLYRSARPFFLGLIIGEAFSAVLWTVIPLVMWWAGAPYTRPQVSILF